jgi:hypothetical protein
MVGKRSVNETLASLYYDPLKSSAYSGVSKLFKKAKELLPDIKKEEVKEWLRAQHAYTLHKKNKRKFVGDAL